MPAQLLRSLSIFQLAFRILLDYLWLDFTNRFRSEAGSHAADHRAYARWGRLLRQKALALGGVIIKVGQFLSTRADVLPDVFTRELSTLQDAVASAPFPAVRARVEAELGAPLDQVFAEFTPQPLASASLGQVHLAVLPEGTAVAVKVLRPGIEQLVATDLEALRRVVSFLDRFTAWGRRFDLHAMVDEFETTTLREMDYQQEAAHIRRFRQNLAAVPGVEIPFPYDNLVTRRVLVMEFMEGMKVTERERLQAAGVDTVQVARTLVDAFLQQVVIDGLVHADPHPGNLLVRPDGSIVLLDFGMIAEITAADKRNIADLTTALLTRDLDRAVDDLRKLEILRPEADSEPLKRALSFLLDHVTGVKLNPGPDFDRFLVQFREWLYEEPVQVPARYIFLGRAVGLLAGLAAHLDPDIDWVGILKEKALPMLTSSGPQTGQDGAAPGSHGQGWQQWVADLFGPTVAAGMSVAWKEVSAATLSAARLPGEIERVLTKADTGKLQVRIDPGPLADQLDRNGIRTAWALVAAGAGIAGAMLRINGFATEAFVAWGAALIGLAQVAFGGGRRRRTRRAPRR